MTRNNVDKEANSLINEIISYSSNIPDPDMYDLKKKIRTSAKMMVPVLRSLNQKKTKMEKIKGKIEANALLSEVKEYLTLSARLQFGDTKTYMTKMEKIFTDVYTNMSVN